MDANVDVMPLLERLIERCVQAETREKFSASRVKLLQNAVQRAMRSKTLEASHRVLTEAYDADVALWMHTPDEAERR